MNKKCFILLIAIITMVTGQANAVNRIYIDDLVLHRDEANAYGKYCVTVKASFDSYVSFWDLSLVFPEGINVTPENSYTMYEMKPEAAITYDYYSKRYGWTVETETPSATGYTKGQMTRIISSSLLTTGYDPDMEPDENGNPKPYGGIKWHPGEYELFDIYFSAYEDFSYGEIQIVSNTVCGWDERFGNIYLVEDSTCYPIYHEWEDEEGNIDGYYIYLGDVNNDLSLTVADVTSLMDYILTDGTYESYITFENCDINLDGVIDLLDIVELMDYLFTGEGLNHGYRRVGYELQTAQAAVTVVFPEEIEQPGDLSGDGVLGIDDVTLLIDAILSGENPFLGDVNGDDRVTVSDITDLIDLILS